MLEYEFMRNAFVAGGIVAIVCGTTGVFLVLRQLAFAGHALSHIGFAGAAGSALLGIAPLWGLVAFTLAAAIAMGLLGERMRGRDVAIGIVLSLALGLGVLFLYLYTSHATQATTILFGNVLGVSRETVWALAGMSVISVGALAFISRPLLFATLAPELAEAKGVSMRLVAVLFLAIVAVAVAAGATIRENTRRTPTTCAASATALRLTSRAGFAVALAVSLALLETWAGIATAYVTNLPPSFWIVLLGCAGYLFALLYCWARDAGGWTQGASSGPVDRRASRATGCASVIR